jgi:hypothetical protein
MALVAGEFAALMLIVIAFYAAKRLLPHAAIDLLGDLGAPTQPPRPPSPDELVAGSWDGDPYDDAIWGDRPEEAQARISTMKERRP